MLRPNKTLPEMDFPEPWERTQTSPEHVYKSQSMFEGLYPIELEIGARFERFSIQNKIADGRRGHIYMALDHRNNQPTVIKIAELRSQQIPQIFEAAIDFHQRLSDSTHILKLYGYALFPYRGTKVVLIPMEYAQEGNFAQWIQRHCDDSTTRLQEGIELFKQFCFGIVTLHSNNALHLNIKPQNLLLVNGVGKVADFRYNPKTSTSQDPLLEPIHRYSTTNGVQQDLFQLGMVLCKLIQPDFNPIRGPISTRRIDSFRAPQPMVYCIKRCLHHPDHTPYGSIQELLQDLNAMTRLTDQEFLNRMEGKIMQPHLQNIEEKIRGKQYNQAFQLVNNLCESNPDCVELKNIRTALQEKFDHAQQLLHEANEKFGQVNLSDISELYKIAINLFPDHPMVNIVGQRLHSRSQEYFQLMESIIAANNNKDYDNALALAYRVQEINPSERIKNFIADCTKKRDQKIQEERERQEKINRFYSNPRYIDSSSDAA